jgi:hypothetical protein
MINPYQLTPTVALVKRVAKVHEQAFPYDKLNYAAVKTAVDHFRSNRTYNNIRIKVDVINGIFNTAIRDTFGVARQIHERVERIDSRLEDGDVHLIAEIARYEQPNEVFRTNYSFATKFCHFHYPEAFPIYDKFVVQSLLGYRMSPDFSFFAKGDLKKYPVFLEVNFVFREVYGLSRLPASVVDRFLWATGKHGNGPHLQRVFREFR